MDYQQQAFAVKNSVELVVALYDGMVRFLHKAEACVRSGDSEGRRQNIKRVLDILTYLQGRLRTDVGGQSAKTLGEFYAAMYSQCVLASRDSSVVLLEETIRNVRNVRDAWHTVATSESAQGMVPRDLQTREERTQSVAVSSAARGPSGAAMAAVPEEGPVSHRWSA
jgi:flagellar protein FliS